ncbi:MAG TPA: alpha/beta hydrolase, partial [Alphaproteobacteria bacterium]|nr:alpha/beta hydrolase [Alphaproteobacteria bacterium]
MSFDWRAHEAEELERHFNPRVAVPEAAELLERYAARAAAARQALPGTYDMRYGSGEKQTFDLHPPARPADGKPLLVFIHGGYWRALDKSDHSFVVPVFTAAGATVVNLNYDL